jgi:hypothetical protein
MNSSSLNRPSLIQNSSRKHEKHPTKIFFLPRTHTDKVGTKSIKAVHKSSACVCVGLWLITYLPGFASI